MARQSSYIHRDEVITERVDINMDREYEHADTAETSSFAIPAVVAGLHSRMEYNGDGAREIDNIL